MQDSNKHDVVGAALKVLNNKDPQQKLLLTNTFALQWREGQIGWEFCKPQTVPDRPQRDDENVKCVQPRNAPKRGKGGSLASRVAIIHSLVHIESWAVDLSWDIIARFGQQRELYANLPRGFFDDFVRVAEDEARHYGLLKERLEELDSYYGALPVHDALWDSASRTAGSLPARLAIEHCVHEARGLDVMPSIIEKFRTNGDTKTADLLENVIYKEEISHCAAGVRWLKWLHEQATENQAVGDWADEARNFATVEEWFHYLIRQYFTLVTSSTPLDWLMIPIPLLN
eukprot:TRINITY_DN1783_c0_g1_i2.p1 TRINITY_DN1783_c0_g1~~TRINITY_DN1783_c0_g1_i2.p1  ORF type:complete len:286 (-),score=53.16 TRINITY_DN1783_c0_g1_i2:16-873(-)